MSSFDKTVKLATKPTSAMPKSKYLQPIIAATWSDGGAVSDVCRALSPRLREPNAVVVFKALIVLHNMIRNGATDNVLAHLSASDVLRLKNVGSGNWEGYNAPKNLSAYAVYLDSRIRAFKDLKHDAIRVQSESNRDMRSTQGFEEDAPPSKSTSKAAPKAAHTRSKTIMGRKLRVMTVEKGLLRETKTVHKMIDTLLECKFYHDNLEDELIVTALSMLVKDLLILFQAGNEGVINVLEHYFEMSFVDASAALELYRKFCKQTEHVVEFLGIARKLSNLLNISVPNLRHAPVSLAGALQDYLDDPNFEQNRIEYKLNKDNADKAKKGGKAAKSGDAPPPVPALPASTSSPSAATATTTPQANGQDKNKDVLDFFAAIEQEQTPIFNGQPSPNFQVPQFQQPMPTGAPNPFLQRQMMTGQPFMQQQPTGFPMMVQQQPGLAAPNPFGQLQASQSLQPQLTGHRPFSAFVPQQPTGMPLSQPMQVPGMLQPQTTGSNPFRQSVMIPNTTGMPNMGMGGPFGGGMGTNPFPSAIPGTAVPGQQQPNGFTIPPMPNSAGATTGAFSGMPGMNATPFGQQQVVKDVPARPASTPLTSVPSAQTTTTNSPPEAQPVKRHITGTNNPFGPVVTAPPPVPKPPTMFDLMSRLNNMNMNNGPQSQSQPAPSMLPQTSTTSTMSPTGAGSVPFGFNSNALSAGQTDISSIASSFAFSSQTPKVDSTQSGTATPSGTTATTTSPSNGGFPPSLPDFNQFSSPLASQNTAATSTSSAFSDSLFSSLSSQPTGLTGTSAGSTPLTSQATGFTPLKAFKPSSSFGAQLLGSLPPIPGSAPTTPAASNEPTSPLSLGAPPPSLSTSSTPALPSQTTSTTPSFSALGAQPSSFGAFGQPSALSNPTSPGSAAAPSTLGVGLRPQLTGGASNPFRASMFATGNAPPVPSMPTGMFGAPQTGAPGGMPAFGSMPAFGGGIQPSTNGQQQQQPGGGSLI